MDLVASVYEAALRPDRWSVFLDGLATAIHGAATHILVQGRKGRSGVFAGVRGDPEHYRLYGDYYCRLNPYILHPACENTPGLVHSGQWCEAAAVKRTEFYSDFLMKAGVFPALCSNLFHDGARVGYLVSYRPLAAKPFQVEDAKLLRALTPHVQRALQVGDAMKRVQDEHCLVLDALDHLTQAIIILDGKGRPRMINRAASAILAERDGLSCQRGELRAAASVDNRRLTSLIASVLKTQARELESHPGGLVAIERPSGRAALAVLVSPLHLPRTTSMAFDGLDGAAAVVLLAAPDQGLAVPRNSLRILLGLTAREAEVTQLLLQGYDVRQVARCLGMAYHTARVHQRTVYEKSGVHDKAELMRLVLRGIPQVQGESLDPAP
jgi:DNA-binding CsgD family transcriptional regulator